MPTSLQLRPDLLTTRESKNTGSCSASDKDCVRLMCRRATGQKLHVAGDALLGLNHKSGSAKEVIKMETRDRRSYLGPLSPSPSREAIVNYGLSVSIEAGRPASQSRLGSCCWHWSLLPSFSSLSIQDGLLVGHIAFLLT